MDLNSMAKLKKKISEVALILKERKETSLITLVLKDNTKETFQLVLEIRNALLNINFQTGQVIIS